MFRPKKRAIGKEAAEAIAVAALSYLAQDENRLNAFLTNTGLGVDDLRAAAGQPQFFSALLDHVTGDNDLILGVAAEADIAPETVAAAAYYFRRDEF